MRVEHERALMLDGLLPGAAAAPHKTSKILLRVMLFVLTTIGALSLDFFLDEIGVPRQGIATGLIAIALAEFLIRALRWWWTGVEEALWIGGVYAILSELPHTGAPEAMLVMAAGAAVSGARVRNPLFGALAACFVSVYFEKRWDLGVLAALIIGLAASFALLRTWRRPSNEFLFIAIAVVLPAFGYSQADANWRTATIALYLAFGIATLFLAIRYRDHALFLGGAIGFGIAAFELARMIDIAVEAKLAIGGAILLAGSWLASRALRDRTTGIVATPAKLTPFDDELQLAAAFALPSALPRADFDQKMESGGEFGGAGATGKY